MRKIILPFLLVCSSGMLHPLFAQETGKNGQFWLHAGAETALYGQGSGARSGTAGSDTDSSGTGSGASSGAGSSGAFGGGLSGGYSMRGGAFAAKAAWFGGAGGEGILELTLMLRFWLGLDPFSGGFFQFQAGAIFFAPNAAGIFSADGEVSGTVSFAVFGYRFPLKNRFYIEPSVRMGYPYIIGASVSAGMHF